MIKTGHLETYDVILTVRTPLHIGSGHVINKQEYAYGPRSKTVRIIDMERFLQILAEKGLAREYENFIIRGTYKGGLSEFLAANSFTPSEIDGLTIYTCSVRGVFEEAAAPSGGYGRKPKKPKNEIAQFIRMKDGRPYLPGSSLKGALRTCLFTTLCERDADLGSFLELKNRDSGKIDVRRTAIGDKQAGEAVFNTLKINPQRPRDAVNSVMKSISISDSEPLSSDSMILCKKKDLLYNGSINEINVLRECVRPDTTIRCKLTIDRSIDGLTLDDVRNAIRHFYAFYQKTYIPCFINRPANFSMPEGNDYLILGGGAGFFSKTVLYNLNKYEVAKNFAKNYFVKKLSKMEHIEKSPIIPYTLNCTQYSNRLMHFGICGIEVK